MRQIRLFDTTLRDGEQSPGCSMSGKEKIDMARALESLGVDVIEAGTAAAGAAAATFGFIDTEVNRSGTKYFAATRFTSADVIVARRSK